MKKVPRSKYLGYIISSTRLSSGDTFKENAGFTYTSDNSTVSAGVR